MKYLISCPILILSIASLSQTSAFIPTHSPLSPSPRLPLPSQIIISITTQSPRHITKRSSRKSTALFSLFGLGPLELLTIAFAGLLVIGPTKLSEMSRQAGQVAGKSKDDLKDGVDGLKEAGVPEEWKAIPEEFKKGIEEGEIEARGRRAKVMKEIDD